MEHEQLALDPAQGATRAEPRPVEIQSDHRRSFSSLAPADVLRCDQGEYYLALQRKTGALSGGPSFHVPAVAHSTARTLLRAFAQLQRLPEAIAHAQRLRVGLHDSLMGWKAAVERESCIVLYITALLEP
jgi:hypothetical protein